MFVDRLTRRTRLLSASAMRRLPDDSMATPTGDMSTLVARPPSPLRPLWPRPAKVVMIPVESSTRRPRWLYTPAVKRYPSRPSCGCLHGDHYQRCGRPEERTSV